MEICYSPTFIRLLKALPPAVREEAVERIEWFKRPDRRAALKIHKLKGRLKGRLSFSVNYRFRVVFTYLRKNPRTAFLLAIGDHSVYDA